MMTWAVTSVSENKIAIKMDFKNPILVSASGDAFDQVKVDLNMDLFVDEDFLTLEQTSLRAEIPRQLS